MVTTVNLSAEIPENRELRITLPGVVPPGPAEIVVVVSPRSQLAASTLGELLASEFFGMWRDRSDITDSLQFAHQLRAEGWQRPG